MRLLLEAGADKEAKNKYGDTPLIKAAYKGHEAVVPLLLEAGADKEAKNKDGITPLIAAAEKGHEAIVQRLLEAGADAEAKDNDLFGKTAFYYARKNGHTSVAELLPASSGCCVLM